VPEKNFHLLMQAFLNLRPTGYNLVIAGDADIEDAYSLSLKSFAKDNGIVLTGFIKGEKLYTLLSNAALFVLPSSHEGLPIALLEAMSYGLPVLASDIPANKEVHLPPSCYFHYEGAKVGEGVLSPLRRIGLPEVNVNNLTEALTLKLNDLSEPVYDLSAYNWDRIAEQTAEVYNRTQA